MLVAHHEPHEQRANHSRLQPFVTARNDICHSTFVGQHAGNLGDARRGLLQLVVLECGRVGVEAGQQYVVVGHLHRKCGDEVDISESLGKNIDRQPHIVAACCNHVTVGGAFRVAIDVPPLYEVEHHRWRAPRVGGEYPTDAFALGQGVSEITLTKSVGYVD